MATWFGIVLAIHPWTFALASATWLAAAALTRISSLGALVASASAPLWLILFQRWEAVLFAAVLAVLIWLRHHENIRRILAGEETRIGQGKG